MYIPKKFKQEKIEDLIKIMQQYPFATVIANSHNGIEATHLPVLLEQVDDKLIIKAHIAKANSLWKQVANGSDVLVIFNGPNCYISANHYPTKAENGRAVPTWNYVVVHAKGSISFINDTNWIYGVIDELTNLHESNSASPWSISDAPEQYIQKLLTAIIGIEIEVNSIEGQWKLSQNQPLINQQGVINGLSSQSDAASRDIAAMVKAQGE